MALSEVASYEYLSVPEASSVPPLLNRLYFTFANSDSHIKLLSIFVNFCI